MGQAKNRGDFAARQKEAIDAGRVKGPRWVQQDPPTFVVQGHKPSLAQTLTEISNQRNLSTSAYGPAWHVAAQPRPFHELSPGAERSAKDLSSPHISRDQHGNLNAS